MANAIRTELVEKIVAQCGDDLWGECKQFSKDDWKYEVENGDTVLGYWEWVLSQAESNEVAFDSLTALPSA